MVDLRVAALAQGHEVAFPVIAALRYGKDMMYLLHRGEPAFFQAAFAQRMGGGVAITDPFPGPSVFLVDVRGAFVSVVAVALRLRMLLAVLTALNGKSRTAGVTARSAWLSRHGVTSVRETAHGVCIL